MIMMLLEDRVFPRLFVNSIELSFFVVLGALQVRFH